LHRRQLNVLSPIVRYSMSLEQITLPPFRKNLIFFNLISYRTIFTW
jgi:hypothetical protein